MGLFETITETLKDEKDLRVRIEQNEGTLLGNIVVIKNIKTGRNYAFTLKEGNEYQAEKLAKVALEKLRSKRVGCNEKTLNRIERALGRKFEKWQADYILSESLPYPLDGRRTGKTLAYQIKTLLNTQEDQIIIYRDDLPRVEDENHNSSYERYYVEQLAELSYQLRKAYINVPDVILKLNRNRRPEFDGRRNIREWK